MPIAPVERMTVPELYEYIEKLERKIREQERKLDNSRKLDLRDARRIRALHAGGAWTQRELAEAFNVNSGTISRIISGDYYPEPVAA